MSIMVRRPLPANTQYCQTSRLLVPRYFDASEESPPLSIVLPVHQILQGVPSTFNGQPVTQNTDLWNHCTFAMALFSGILQLFMGFFRVGFIMNFISQPVVSAFTSAAGVLVASTQVRWGSCC